MSTVNFSVPEEVKTAFNAAFEGKNKSAIIAELMLEAVDRVQRRQQSQAASRRILERRERAPATTQPAFQAARSTGRP